MRAADLSAARDGDGDGDKDKLSMACMALDILTVIQEY
jgi:hypothetical protein